MNWIEEKEVTSAALRGLDTALNNVIEHWEQLSHNSKIVHEAVKEGKTGIAADDCALCTFQLLQGLNDITKCNNCIADTNIGCCDGLYEIAKKVLYQMYFNVEVFGEASLNVAKYLRKLKDARTNIKLKTVL